MDTPEELCGTLWSIVQMACMRGPLAAYEIDKEFKGQFDVSPDFRKFGYGNLDAFLHDNPHKFIYHENANRWSAVSSGTDAEATQKALMACSKLKNRGSAQKGRFSSSRGAARPTSYGTAFNASRGGGRGGGMGSRPSSFSPAPSQQNFRQNQNYGQNNYDNRDYAPSRNESWNGGSRSESRNEGFRSEAPSRNDFGYNSQENRGFGKGYDDPNKGFNAPNNNYNGGGGSSFARQEQHYSREERNTSYESHNSYASSGGNGYVSAEDNQSFGGRQMADEPPPPAFGQTGRSGGPVNNNFGSRRDPSPPRRTPPVQEHRSAFAPPPGLAGPPPGLEKVKVYHGSVFDRTSPLKDMSNTSRSESQATITKEPKDTPISIHRDAVPHALTILRDKWPVAIEGAQLVDLLSDVPHLEAYCASFVDQRDVLVNKLVDKANKEKLRVYVEKRFKGSVEQTYLSFIPGHPRAEDSNEQMLESYKMICHLLKRYGPLHLKDITARLGIESRGKYAPRAFVWTTIQEHKDTLTVRNSPGEQNHIVSLIDGVDIPAWEISKTETFQFNEELSPPSFDSLANKEMIEMARRKIIQSKLASAEAGRAVSTPKEAPPPANFSRLMIDRNRVGEWISNVRLSAYQDLTSFAIRTKEEVQEFTVLTGKLMEKYSIRGCQKPSYAKGELVCCCIDEQYFRAVITETSRNNYRVDRIDVGDYCSVDRRNIYQLNESEFKKPALATRCTVRPFEVAPDCEASYDDEERGCGDELQKTPVELLIHDYRDNDMIVHLRISKDDQTVLIPGYFFDTGMIRFMQ